MSNATPPGWYPDVRSPGTERWWDGTAGTAYTRPLAVTQQQGYVSQQFGAPYLPQQRSAGADGNGGRRGRAIAITLSALVVIGVVATSVVLLGKDGGGGTQKSAPGASASGPAPSDTASASAGGDAPADDPDVLVDQLDGITLPVPHAWEKPESTVEDVTTMRTDDSYSCPGDSGSRPPRLSGAPAGHHAQGTGRLCAVGGVSLRGGQPHAGPGAPRLRRGAAGVAALPDGRHHPSDQSPGD